MGGGFLPPRSPLAPPGTADTLFCFTRLRASPVKYTTATIAASTLLACAVIARANEYLPGKHDSEALRLRRSMSEAIPLRTTALKDIAPEFAVEKQDGLTWEEAVAEASARFGRRQPRRAAFCESISGEDRRKRSSENCN